ncbi:MAG: hypothetical protein P8L84_07260 [Methylococcaceae bacterium]|nr:hypothetical protein [Methylococcaceae bacterium]
MRFFLWFIVLFPMPLYSQDASVDFVQYRYKIAFLPNQDEPYTGDFNYVSKKGDREVGPFLNGQREGLWRYSKVDPDNKERSEIHFKAGLKEGPATQWAKNGNKLLEEHYLNGKRTGGLTQWYTDLKEVKEGVPPSAPQKKVVENYIKGKKEGLREEWFVSGQKKSEENFKKNKLEGISVFWYENEHGQKQSESNYLKGKRQGRHRDWYTNGQLKTDELYQKGKRSGLSTLWYENVKDQIKTETNYLRGLKSGLFIEWFPSGKKQSETTFKKNKKQGQHNQWYSNGKLQREEYYKNNRVTGPTRKEWDKKGRLIVEEALNSKGVVTEGTRTSWHRGQQKKRVTEYIQIKKKSLKEAPHGLTMEWGKRGKVLLEEHYSKGKKEGVFIKYSAKGKLLSKYQYSADKKHGPFIENTKKGRPSKQGTFKHNLKEGLFVRWYSNGNKESEAFFTDGKLEGQLTTWYKNGQKKSVKVYKMGKEIPSLGFAFWDKSGQIIKIEQYKDGRKHGLWLSSYAMGQKKLERYFNHGFLNGPWILWDQKGHIQVLRFLENGVELESDLHAFVAPPPRAEEVYF